MCVLGFQEGGNSGTSQRISLFSHLFIKIVEYSISVLHNCENRNNRMESSIIRNNCGSSSACTEINLESFFAILILLKCTFDNI